MRSCRFQSAIELHFVQSFPVPSAFLHQLYYVLLAGVDCSASPSYSPYFWAKTCPLFLTFNTLKRCMSCWMPSDPAAGKRCARDPSFELGARRCAESCAGDPSSVLDERPALCLELRGGSLSRLGRAALCRDWAGDPSPGLGAGRWNGKLSRSSLVARRSPARRMQAPRPTGSFRSAAHRALGGNSSYYFNIAHLPMLFEVKVRRSDDRSEARLFWSG